MTTVQRRRTSTTIAVVLSALLVFAAVMRLSSAGFTARTDNGSGWQSGVVSISDDDSGTALFDSARDGLMDGGQSSTRCITVTYTGSLTSNVTVRAFATAAGALAPYLNLTVEEGTGATPGSCTGFAATSTLYTGTLADFAATHGTAATGVSAWAPTATNEARSYRFTTTVQNATGAQNAAATATFSWTAASFRPPTYAEQVMADSPLAYWRLDSATPGVGTHPATLIDSSGNNHPFTTNPLWVGAPGAANIGGDSADVPQYQYATDPATWLRPLTSYSVETWVKNTRTSGQSFILAMDDNASAPGSVNRKFGLYLNNGQPVFMVFTGAGGYPYAQGTTNVADNAWHHLVGTNDGTTLRLYVDGALQATTPIGGTQTTGITRYLTLGGEGAVYQGSIDETAIYPGALSAARVAAHYATATH